MAADFSRVRLNPLLDYAGVELKQGAVLLDADANELVAILDRRLRALASDTLGRATVSATTPAAFKITAAGGKLLIDKGRLYVDGLLAENHGAESSDAAKRRFDSLLAEPIYSDQIAYDDQPYLRSAAPALPTAGRHLVYLDVWQREVTHLEQPALVETAVGVETSSRLQTVWQVRVLAGDAGADASCIAPDDALPGWSALISPSTGVLSTGTFDVAPTDDPCELPPTGGYRGLENQLYRVEIHDPGQPGAGATFKWSRENASVGSRVASIVSGTVLELQSLGRDDVLRFNTGDWVEIIDDLREFAQAAGEIRRITVDEANHRISFSPALPAAMLPATFPDDTLARTRNLRVRRWDHKGKVFRTDSSGTPVQVQDLDAAGSNGVIKVPAEGTALLLEDGVTVSFASTGATGFRAGDYFVFAARTADASVEKLDRAPPRGIHHHYARLGIWDVAAGAVTDCRHPWPPETAAGGDCGCTACVTPASHASGQLTIQGAVDKVRDTGGTVCLHPGQYLLREPVKISGARSLRIHGQGPATVIVASTAAFIIERSIAIAIDELAIVTPGFRSAISVRTVLGLALRRLVVALLDNADSQGAAVALSGLVLGASIQDNLLFAPDGVAALEPAREEAPQSLVSALLRIDDNVFLCRDSAVKLEGQAGHAYETRITGNQVLATHEVGIAVAGLALPGASFHVSANKLDVHGPGIRCGADAAWVEDNQLRATRDGDRMLAGAGIALVPSLARGGSDKAHVLANHVSGFPDAGVLIVAPVQDLSVTNNMVSDCGNGILMADSASAAALVIENNHLRDIGPPVASGDRSVLTAGIVIAATETASVVGNTLRRIGLQASPNSQLIAAIAAFAVPHARICTNQVSEVGPIAGSGATMAGIMIRAPYEQAEVMHNHVERDRLPAETRSGGTGYALQIQQPGTGANNGVSRMAGYAALRVDAENTLVMRGTHAYVLNAITVNGSSVSVLGNVLIARGNGPAVEVTASREILFNDNRCELRGFVRTTAVLLDTPVAVINGNRVRGALSASISVPSENALVAAIGNITTNGIHARLKPEMELLNLIG
jgi:hypothetical protein